MPSWFDQYRGARARSRRRVEPQVLSNARVHQASGRKSAKQTQTVRELTGRVSKFRALRVCGFQHDVGDDARFITRGHYLFEHLAQGRTGLAILIELRRSE